MKNILITGGAGYKGILLTKALLEEGYNVTIMDNFMYGFDPILTVINYDKCNVIKKDIRNLEEKDVKDYDIIYHLAGISGFPACDANPHSAQIINVDSTDKLVKLLSNNQLIVYASTTSFYGQSGDERDENSIPEPTSLYGRTKYEAEKICMSHKNGISLRFATIFGVAPKMRNDLMLNDFVFRAITEHNLVLFDSKSIRTFLHIKDAIDAYLMVAKMSDKTVGKIFNVGCNSMNYSKMDIALVIKKHIDFSILDTSLKDPDKRNYKINYDKIAKLGFKSKISIDEGIEELIKLYSVYRPYSAFQTI